MVQILLMLLLHRAQLHRLFDNLVATIPITVQALLKVSIEASDRLAAVVKAACDSGTGSLKIR